MYSAEAKKKKVRSHYGRQSTKLAEFVCALLGKSLALNTTEESWSVPELGNGTLNQANHQQLLMAPGAHYVSIIHDDLSMNVRSHGTEKNGPPGLD